MLILQLLTLCLFLPLQENKAINKSEFYHHLSSTDESKISKYIDLLSKDPNAENAAYQGTLEIKMAGYAKKPKDKLSLFKKGAKKLDGMVEADKKNGEYRFLRLVSQENAPAIVGYKSNLLEDKAALISSFKSMEKVVQSAILEYCRISKILRAEDFQN